MKKFLPLVLLFLFLIKSAYAVPLPPEIALEKDGTFIEISWNPVVGADGYKLYYAAYPYAGPESIGSIDVQGTSVAFFLWDGASYYVSATAYDQSGESRYSNAELFLLAPPLGESSGGPDLVVETDALDIFTSWSEVPAANNYRLYYAPYPFSDPATVGHLDLGNTTTFDATLWNGAAYYVAVAAENDGSESGFSNIELFLTGNPVPEWLNSGYLDSDNDGYSVDEGDCDDTNNSTNPGTTEVCGDSTDNNCDGSIDEDCLVCTDTDDDGYAVEGGSCGVEDCDDSSASIYPDAVEVCDDSIDNNCDGSIDEGCLVCTDADDDGYSAEGGACGVQDCNDYNPGINPDATDVCGDGVDQDCSGQDNLCPVTLTGLTITGGTQVNEGSTLQLSATASWSDGSTTNVTSSATWSESSSAVTSVTNGLVSAGSVSSDTPATINASYSSGGITETASTSITVKNVATPGTVTSATGRVWMDKNLGASQVATAYNDSAAYGDLYQWGRGTDGHEKRASLTTTTLSSSDTPGHGSFITGSSDWRSSQNDNLWQGVSGANNPCPSGFRLPTITEWEAERLTWSTNNQAGAFASPLSLVSAGYRDYLDGSVYLAGSGGVYWSSSVNGSYARFLYFYSGDANTYYSNRAYGFSARCLED